MNTSLIGSRLEAFAKRIGRSTARTPLLLYYVLESNDTSFRDKAIIATCLAYVILPIDLIPSNRFSVLGWADEVLSIEIVFDRMRKYITPEMYARAEKQLNQWIPDSSNNFTKVNKSGFISRNQQKQIQAIVSKWKN